MSGVLIGIRILLDNRRIDRSFWMAGKIAVARTDRRKNVKRKVWVKPERFPIKHYDVVVCEKTGRKYRLLFQPVRTRYSRGNRTYK